VIGSGVLGILALSLLVTEVIPRSEQSSRGIALYAACRDKAHSQLKAPATARFPEQNEKAVTLKVLPSGRGYVMSYVDAQNGFGALIRTKFRCVGTAENLSIAFDSESDDVARLSYLLFMLEEQRRIDIEEWNTKYPNDQLPLPSDAVTKPSSK